MRAGLRRALAIVAIGILAALPAAAGATAQQGGSVRTVRIGDLLTDPSRFDGSLVQVQGEVIGDVMLRGEYGWINVSDGSGAIGVWAPSSQIRTLVGGRYARRGDVVRVTGVFWRSDFRQGGELDIEGQEVTRIEAARARPHPVDPRRGYLTLGLSFVGALLGLIWWQRERAARRAA